MRPRTRPPARSEGTGEPTRRVPTASSRDSWPPVLSGRGKNKDLGDRDVKEVGSRRHCIRSSPSPREAGSSPEPRMSFPSPSTISSLPGQKGRAVTRLGKGDGDPKGGDLLGIAGGGGVMVDRPVKRRTTGTRREMKAGHLRPREAAPDPSGLAPTTKLDGEGQVTRGRRSSRGG